MYYNIIRNYIKKIKLWYTIYSFTGSGNMMSERQTKEKISKVLKVCKYFLKNPNSTIEEISQALDISKSSVQRYLNEKEIIESLDELGIEVYELIQKQLRINTLLARSKGGKKFASKNVALKDDSGKFIGSIKK